VVDLEPANLDPFASPTLRDRLPHLETAMESGHMAGQLDRALLDGTGLTILGCERPRAHVIDGLCRIQYPLQIGSASGQVASVLVLATMFGVSGPGDAASFHRTCLLPLAARWAPAGTARPAPTGVIDALAMAVSVFPINPRLPTLVDLANEGRASEMVATVLPAGTGPVTRIELARLGRTTGCVLRYHLGSDRNPSGEGVGSPAVVYAKVGSAAAIDELRIGLGGLAQH
jgi:hypothetical protein